MKFTKMLGAGNDYVYVNAFEESLPADLPALSVAMSHRHFGVGADGLIVIHPSDIADARMQMFNADGSESEMCGNGIRCVAKYVYDHGICGKESLTIETGAGVLALEVEVVGDQVERVRVDMGEPILDAGEIPTTFERTPVANQVLEVDGQTFEVTCVSMGNPHCVIYVDEAPDELVLGVGPKIENFYLIRGPEGTKPGLIVTIYSVNIHAQKILGLSCRISEIWYFEILPQLPVPVWCNCHFLPQ